MSKHSKWAKVKNQKIAADQKKGAIFTKHVRAVTVAARAGTDPDVNFKLRVALETAKTAGLPKDTIARALSRAADKSAATMEEMIYEGFAPGGAVLIIETVTDNKNRTASEIRHLLEKFGGSLGHVGSVLWQFNRWGVIRISASGNEETELRLIDWGAEEIRAEDNGLTVYVKPEYLRKLLEGLRSINITPSYSGLEWVSKEPLTISDPLLREKLDQLYEALDEHADVQNYFTNER